MHIMIQSFQLNCFNCHIVLIVNIYSCINFAEIVFVNFIVQPKRVILNHFPHIIRFMTIIQSIIIIFLALFLILYCLLTIEFLLHVNQVCNYKLLKCNLFQPNNGLTIFNIIINRTVANNNFQSKSRKKMKEKLIITVWKAQLNEKLNKDSIYCRLNYNNEFRNTKYLDNSKSLVWKQTFVFPLSKVQMSLRIDFISLDKGEAIHFAKDNVAQTLSFGKSIAPISVKNATKGTFASKLDIYDQNQKAIGKVFIQYEVLRTQVAYIVEKQLDYNYLLKLGNFKVSFLRNLKRVPNFYLNLIYDGNVHKQEFPFSQENGVFSYNYPVKLYMKKQLQMQIQLQVKQFFGIDFNNANQSMRSQSFNQKKSQSSLGKKNTIDLGSDKVTSTLQLSFKKNQKLVKKIPVFIVQKQQKREIGSIQFSIQTIFKTEEQKLALQQQKAGIGSDNAEIKQQKIQKKRKANVQQGNGIITINAIMGRLQLFNQQLINNKNISLVAKLGKQVVQSTVLQNPGVQLIFIDSFTFKRTWEETIKFTIQIHKDSGIKLPTFFAAVNLRQLFQIGKVKSKKVKVTDQNKNYCGELSLDMQYKEEEKKVIKDTSHAVIQQIKPQDLYEKKMQQKRQIIAQRIRKKQQQKKAIQAKSLQKGKQMITISQALELKDLILPPLFAKKRQNNNSVNQSRYSTLSPKQKNRNGFTYNSNGGIKFSRSPRFIDPQKTPQSYLFIQRSQFNIQNKKKGAFIGFGVKHDFTKDYQVSPGVGKYSIPSVWDKYN